MSQGRVPLSQTESAKDSGHYQAIRARAGCRPAKLKLRKILDTTFLGPALCHANQTPL